MAKIDWSIQIFFRFWIFWEFFQNCLIQANFDLSSWNFVGKCTNTEWCLIPNFIRILDEFDFLIFFIVTSNYKNSMFPRSFLCEEAKIKQRTPLKKELCEIREDAIWESRFTCFFQIFVISRSIEILIETNFWLGMYVPYILKCMARTSHFEHLQWKINNY